MSSGRRRARTSRSMAIVSIRTSGPCCQRARVAVDQIEVHREKMNVEARAIARLWNCEWMTQKKRTPATAPMMLAMNCSVRIGTRVRKPTGEVRTHPGRHRDERHGQQGRADGVAGTRPAVGYSMA